MPDQEILQNFLYLVKRLQVFHFFLDSWLLEFHFFGLEERLQEFHFFLDLQVIQTHPKKKKKVFWWSNWNHHGLLEEL